MLNAPAAAPGATGRPLQWRWPPAKPLPAALQRCSATGTSSSARKRASTTGCSHLLLSLLPPFSGLEGSHGVYSPHVAFSPCCEEEAIMLGVPLMLVGIPWPLWQGRSGVRQHRLQECWQRHVGVHAGKVGALSSRPPWSQDGQVDPITLRYFKNY